jgi:hypothetical protein
MTADYVSVIYSIGRCHWNCLKETFLEVSNFWFKIRIPHSLIQNPITLFCRILSTLLSVLPETLSKEVYWCLCWLLCFKGTGSTPNAQAMEHSHSSASLNRNFSSGSALGELNGEGIHPKVTKIKQQKGKGTSQLLLKNTSCSTVRF